MEAFTSVSAHSQLSDDEPIETSLSHFEELSSDDDADIDSANTHLSSAQASNSVALGTDHSQNQEDDVEEGEMSESEDGSPHVSSHEPSLEAPDYAVNADLVESNEDVGDSRSSERAVEEDDFLEASDAEVLESEQAGNNAAEGSEPEQHFSDDDIAVNGDGTIGEPQIVGSQSPESDDLQVIELDSENEIDNLEEANDERMADERMDDSFAADGTVHAGEVEMVGAESQGGLREVVDSDLKSDLSALDSEEEHQSEPVTSNEAALWLETPIVISVTGDKLLLIPHFKDSSVKDMISLFGVEEVAECSLYDVLHLLRSGDLIDAYSFDAEDELRIDIPQLNLSFSEDNIHTRDIKLVELVGTFNELRRGRPAIMTLSLTTQKRFISQYRLVEQYRDSGKALDEIFHENADVHENGGPSKKRKYS